MRQLIKRLYALTIWAPGAVPPDEWKYRHLKHVLLPLYDVIIIFCGAFALAAGLPSLVEFFPVWMTWVAAMTLLVSGVAALVGISFPKLWLVEACSKIGILTVFLPYAGALIVLATSGDASRAFISGVMVLACLVPLWRLALLADEWQERQEEQAIAEAVVDEK